MEKKKTSLLEDFQEYFDLELVTTPEQLEQVYRIRYRVYCEEFKYEPAEAFPEQLESDDFDGRSSHCLVRHRSSGLPAGCARLVHVDESSLMPMEEFCGDSMEEKVIRSYDGRRDTVCEFSRLAVDGAFRRRAGERATRFGEVSALDITLREPRTVSLIAVSTILAAFAMSDLIGRPHCFAMMEPFLPRLLKRSGIIFQKAGKDIDYHGIRAPYFITTQSALNNMRPELLDLYRWIHQQIETDYYSISE